MRLANEPRRLMPTTCPRPRPSEARLRRHLAGDAGDAAAGIGGARPRDRRGARLRQAGIAAMGRLLQGARRLLAAEAADRRTRPRRGVVAYSSGNFAQGLAAAGEALGIPVTIVMPIDAPAAKRDATAGYGARVVRHRPRRRGRARKSRPKRRARSPTRKVLRCCIRSTIRRSSPARPAPGWRRSTSSRPRAPRPTCCSARSAAAG